MRMDKAHPLILGMLVTALNLGLSSAVAGAESVASKDGVAIVYETAGAGQPALVFIHDWACSRSVWRDQLEAFSKKYQVVALDLAGHGESGGREDCTMEAFAGDVDAVVEKLGLARVVLVGHSMGALVAIRAARDLGDRVIGIVGVDAFQDLGETHAAAQLDRALKPFRDDFKGSTQAFARSLFSEKADPALVQRIASEMSSIRPARGLSALRNEALFNAREELTGLCSRPVRAINSDRFPTNVAADKSICRGFEMIPMTGVGHFVMLEDAARFDQLLDGVVAEIAAKSGA